MQGLLTTRGLVTNGIFLDSKIDFSRPTHTRYTDGASDPEVAKTIKQGYCSII